MTLIMAYHGHGLLAMLGDLMISQTSPVSVLPELPTRYDKTFPVDNAYLSGLQQKVFSINRNIAVGWAGNALVARHIIRRIRDEFTPPYTGIRVLDFIASLGLSDKLLADVSFIFCMFVEEVGDFSNMQVQDYFTKEVRNPSDNSEYFKFAGSGDYHFFETIGFNVKPGNAEATPYLTTISGIIGRGAIAFYHELISDDVHNFYYGGSFEVLFPDLDGFVKFATTTTVWSYDDAGVRLIGPIYMQEYNASGALGLRRFVLQPDGEWEQKLFVVRNFVDDSNSSFSGDNCPQTIWGVHYFIQKNPPHEMQMLQLTGSDPGFRTWLENGKLRMEWTAEFDEQLRSLGVLR